MNFKEGYLKYVDEQTDSSPLYRLPMAYFCASSAVNRNVWMPFGYRKLHPNLYVLLIGASTLQRKSWAQGIAMDLISKIHPELAIGETSSRESFIAELADEQRTPSGCGVWAIDELKGFMDRAKGGKHHIGFIQDLATLYDGHRINRRKGVDKKGTEYFRIEEPFFNLTAACSFEWLTRSIERADVVGGFLARFVWAVSREKSNNSLSWPKTIDPSAKDPLVESLRRIASFSGVCELSGDAQDSWERWYKNFRVAHQGGKWDSSYERLTVIARKVSMLEAIMRIEALGHIETERIQIEKEDLFNACQFVEGVAESFKEIILGDSDLDVKLKKFVMLLIKENVFPRSRAYASIHGLKAEDMNRIEQTLVQADAVVRHTDGFDSIGKPGVVYESTPMTEKYFIHLEN